MTSAREVIIAVLLEMPVGPAGKAADTILAALEAKGQLLPADEADARIAEAVAARDAEWRTARWLGQPLPLGPALDTVLEAVEAQRDNRDAPVDEQLEWGACLSMLRALRALRAEQSASGARGGGETEGG